MFTRLPITWAIKQVFSMMLTAKFLFGHLVQRGYVWEVARQIGLIMSIIEDYDIPRIYTRKNPDGTYDVMDGKQRMKAIYDFLQNVYCLADVDPVTIDVMVTNDDDTKSMETKTYDLNGMYFKDLPVEVQDKIMSYRLSFVHYENISEDEVRKLFLKLNSGKPLSTKARNIASCRDLYTIGDISKHPFFDAILTEKGKADRKGIPMVVKMHEMLTRPVDEISFMSADFNETMSSTDISDTDKAIINNVLDMALRVYNLFDQEKEKMSRRKFSSENNFISLAPFIKAALDDGISDQMFYEFVKANFSGRSSVSDAYASAARSASASTSSIMTRQKELEKAWDNFFTIDGDDVANDPVKDARRAVDSVHGRNANKTTHKAGEAAESVLEASTTTEYRYGMRLRGFAPMCQPMNGLLRREDDTDGEYYDVLVYSRKLTDDELRDYELDQIA